MKRFWLLVALFTNVPGTLLAKQTTAPIGFLGTIDAAFAAIGAALEIIFLSIGGMPLVVLWLLAGAIFYLANVH